MSVFVKICGITNEDDARHAIDCGADALGFNGWPGSKRFIDLEKNSEWIGGLPENVLLCAVVVNPTLENVNALFACGVFDAVQLHGDETADFCANAVELGTIMKALPATPALARRDLAAYQSPTMLLDASVPGAYGGTGVECDLHAAKAVCSAWPNLRFMLAGGLRPDNVATALTHVQPWGVDVAGGVEKQSNPRRKDTALMCAFVRNAQEAATRKKSNQ